jgi:putative transcriptional regulator
LGYSVTKDGPWTSKRYLVCNIGDIMRLGDMSPTAIAEELGNRLKQARLNVNLTQAEVAARTGLNRKTILNAEKGKVQLENFVAILAALDIADQLNMFLPVQGISPIQLAKLKGEERQRASKSKDKKAGTLKDKLSW